MFSVSNKHLTPITSGDAIQAAPKNGETKSKETLLAKSSKEDTVVLSQRPEKTLIDRPVNFVSNFSHTTTMETDLFVRLQNKLPATFDEYMRGNIDQNSLLKTLDKAVSDMVEYYGSKGFDPADITQDILKDLYDDCRIQMVRSADSASYLEGNKVAQEMGCTGFTVYYNSDYYYKSEDLIDTVHDHFEALSVKYGCGPMELERDFPKGDIRNSRYASYTVAVNGSLRGTGGNLIDQTMPPPRGFTMLFDSNSKGLNQYPASMGAEIPGEPSLFDSAVYIQYQGWNFAHRLPTRMDPTQYNISVHLMDVIQSSGKGYPEELKSWLDNFDFFAINVGKLYTDTHKHSY